MIKEFLAFKSNQTWDLVPTRLAENPIIGSKLVYSMKEKSDSSLDRYKACLVT